MKWSWFWKGKNWRKFFAIRLWLKKFFPSIFYSWRFFTGRLLDVRPILAVLLRTCHNESFARLLSRDSHLKIIYHFSGYLYSDILWAKSWEKKLTHVGNLLSSSDQIPQHILWTELRKTIFNHWIAKKIYLATISLH